MRLQVEHLREKLAKSKARLAEIYDSMVATATAQEQERAAQRVRVDSLQAEIEAKRDEAKAHEKRYAQLVRDASEEESALKHELKQIRKLNSGQKAEERATLAEQKEQLAKQDEFAAAQQEHERMAKARVEVRDEIAITRKEIAELDALMPVAARPASTAEGGRLCLPLLVLEFLRANAIKRELQREGWLAVMSLLYTRPADEVAGAMRDAGAVSLVLTSMKVHEDFLDVQGAAIGFVWKLGFCDAACRAQLLEAGAVHLVLRAIALLSSGDASGSAKRTLQQTRTLLYNACGALRMLLGINLADLESELRDGHPDSASRADPAGSPLSNPAASQPLPAREPPAERAQSPVPEAAGEGAPPQTAAEKGVTTPPRTPPRQTPPRTPPSARPHDDFSSAPGSPQGASAPPQPAPASPKRGKLPPIPQSTFGRVPHVSSAPLLRTLRRRQRAADAAARGKSPGADARGPQADSPGGPPPARRHTLDAQALVLTCKAMRDFPDRSLVQEFGIGALRTLVATNPTLAPSFARQRGVSLICDAMRAHPLQTAVNLVALRALHALAVEHAVYEHMKATPGLEAAVVDAERHHMHNSELLQVASRVLAVLPRHTQSRQQQSALMQGQPHMPGLDAAAPGGTLTATALPGSRTSTSAGTAEDSAASGAAATGGGGGSLLPTQAAHAASSE